MAYQAYSLTALLPTGQPLSVAWRPALVPISWSPDYPTPVTPTRYLQYLRTCLINGNEESSGLPPIVIMCVVDPLTGEKMKNDITY